METVKEDNITRIKEASLEERNKKLVRYAIEEVWNKGNYSVLDKIVESDFVIYSANPNKKEVRGKEEVKQFFSSLRKAFPSIKFTILDQVAEGEKVATQWVAEGTHEGSYEGMLATNKSFKVKAIDIDYIKNGKFTVCWTNMDELGLLQQLGILEPNKPREQETPRQAWDQIAEGYHQFVTDTEIWLANEALKRVDLRAGQSFLDVAAGCGGLSLPAARLGAKVLATDWSPEMIRFFNLRAQEEKLSNAKGQVMDGHNLVIEDNLFDVTGSQFGVMLFPDQPRALREMVRVTKPGGKVLLIAYGQPKEIDFLNFFIAALQSVKPDFQGLPTDPPPFEFQLADPGILYQRLKEAGLKNVQVGTVTEHLEFSSGQQLWDWILYGNPIPGHVLSELDCTSDQIGAVRQRLEQMIRGHAGKNGKAILTNPINIGFGTK